MEALRCRALTAGERICAVRRERKRSASLQKPPQASFQGCQEFIGLINVGGAATEESTAADAAGQAPGKTVAIAAGASTSTDFPLWAERNQQPSAPSTHYTSEKVAPNSLGMSLFLDSPLPPGTDSCCLSRAVSVSQSLSGLRSRQSQTHGCFC